MNSPISAKASISRIAPIDLPLVEAQDGSVEVNVVAPAELGIETRAEFEQRRHAPVHRNASGSGLQNAGDDLQQRTLAGAVLAHDAERFAALDFKRDVAERPKIAVAVEAIEGEKLLKPPRWRVVDRVALRNLLKFDGVHGGERPV